MVALVAPQGAFFTSPSAQGTLIVMRLVQLLNTLDPSELGFPLNVIETSPKQSEKAYESIFVIPLGNELNVSFEQALNAVAPILFNPLGKEVSARLEQLAKVYLLILVTPLGKEVSARLEQL